MTEAILEWRSYKYFPYERDFARLEAEKLFRSTSREEPRGLRIASGAFWAEAARLTYFARAVHPGGEVVVPHQTRLEASAHADERERQATRYSAHGLHEYKGKFNPQVVRAIGNMLGLGEKATVLDPFCGSGTTLLECAHAGWSAIGVDRNPLAVRIANAKVQALRRADGNLQEMAAAVVEALSRKVAILASPTKADPRLADNVLGPGWLGELPNRDYLQAWFPLLVLAQVVMIQRVLRLHVASAADRAIFEVVLSNHLRDASLQEPADLRIRRRKECQENYPLADWFMGSLPVRVERIARARQALGVVNGSQRAVLGDIRSIDLRKMPGFPRGGFDAVITSPPYETALPYIDTQRLSLVLLGDIEATEVQETEKALIGARDIGLTERRAIEDAIRQGSGLPPNVIEVCRELLDAAAAPGNGFRRVARPALVYRYFKNMEGFFVNLRRALRPGGQVALVVGTNRTVLGGKEFVIDTPRLLAAVGESCGYSRVEERRMDTYQRYDLHQKNSINAEMLIVLRAP